MSNKLKYMSILIIISLIIISCSSKQRNIEEENIILDVNKNDKVSLFDYFSDVNIIPLETKKDSYLSFPLGEADKVVLYKDKFFFLDFKLNDILVFNKNGKYLYRLDKEGRGPGEHRSIKDFNINRFTNNIEILSLEDQNINIYNSDNFEFIDKIKIPNSIPLVYQFHHLHAKVYAFKTHQNNIEIHIYNINNNKIINTKYKSPKWLTNTSYVSSSRSPFYIYNDSLFYTHIFNGEIFNIDPIDYKIKTRYKWNFGKNTLSLSDIPKDKDVMFYFNFSKELSNRFAENFLVYQENSHYYFTRFKYKKKYKHIILNKTKNEIKIFDNFIEGVQITPQYITDKALYVFVAPKYLDFVINTSFLNEKNKEIYSKIKEDDNMLIIKYTFK